MELSRPLAPPLTALITDAQVIVSSVQLPAPQGEREGRASRRARSRGHRGRKGVGRTADAPRTSEGGCEVGVPQSRLGEQASFERLGERGGAGPEGSGCGGGVPTQRALSAQLSPAPALSPLHPLARRRGLSLPPGRQPQGHLVWCLWSCPRGLCHVWGHRAGPPFTLGCTDHSPKQRLGPLGISGESPAGTFPPRMLLQTLQKWEQPPRAEMSQTNLPGVLSS